jgi:Ca2+-transporting ATPase
MSELATAPPADPARGLDTAEARARLERDGHNELAHDDPPSKLALLAGQFKGVLVWLLIAACAISAALGEVTDAIAIAVILVLNAIVGFLQESRAESALAALRKMSAPRARVLRDGHTTMIEAREVVVGDVLVLEPGDLVAADARITLAHALTANEALLTGESMPVEKRAGGPIADAPLAEQRGRVFAGTAIATGSGRATVDAVAMRTELGKVAKLLEGTDDDATPLEARLERVGRALVALCLGIVLVVAVLGFVRGERSLDILMSAVSLAVAAVPEGLAAIVTIALAIGVQRMAARRVLVRRLPSVETLGCATVICTDKTGTLTTGQMEVRAIEGADERRVLEVATACCDSDLEAGTGDPTELAIERAAGERGIVRAEIEAAHARVLVRPFDTSTKRMSILRDDGVLYVKGALEALLPLATTVPEGITARTEALAARGLRVLAIATGRGEAERDLEIVGLVGLADPPRKEAILAVAAARRAGVRTVMITGDHPTTAAAIAREMGIATDDDDVKVVHARATPQDKLEIVRAWRKRGDVVAMTGDGVNDAPALREADIGIAMGKTGTEVTREAADMILTDDDFASIVAAIREGRGILDNIQKALVYLLTGNSAELFVMLFASIAGLPLPLSALQLLWINLVTDGLPALSLVMEPTGDDVLTRKPRGRTDPILGRGEWTQVVLVGLLHTAVTLGAFWYALHSGRALAEARAFAFSALVFGELWYVFGARSVERTFWEVGAFSNLRLLAIVLVSAALQVSLNFVPFATEIFSISGIDPVELAAIAAAGLVPVTVVELTKLVRRARA